MLYSCLQEQRFLGKNINLRVNIFEETSRLALPSVIHWYYWQKTERKTLGAHLHPRRL